MAQICYPDGRVEKILPDRSYTVSAHELARRLLAGPDLPVATSANNHIYWTSQGGQGPLKLQILNDHVVVGNSL